MHKPNTAHLQPSKRALSQYGKRCANFGYGCVSCEGWLHFDRTGRTPYFNPDSMDDPVQRTIYSRTPAQMCLPGIEWADVPAEVPTTPLT